jgi:hypothetical protein
MRFQSMHNDEPDNKKSLLDDLTDSDNSFMNALGEDFSASIPMFNRGNLVDGDSSTNNNNPNFVSENPDFGRLRQLTCSSGPSWASSETKRKKLG